MDLAVLDQLVDEGERDTRRGRADEGIDTSSKAGIDGLVGDVGGGVARVALGEQDVLVEYATGRVDVVYGELDCRELGRSEEGKVASLGQDRTDVELTV